jgi:hypothetical protein
VVLSQSTGTTSPLPFKCNLWADGEGTKAKFKEPFFPAGTPWNQLLLIATVTKGMSPNVERERER